MQGMGEPYILRHKDGDIARVNYYSKEYASITFFSFDGSWYTVLTKQELRSLLNNMEALDEDQSTLR